MRRIITRTVTTVTTWTITWVDDSEAVPREELADDREKAAEMDDNTQDTENQPSISSDVEQQ